MAISCLAAFTGFRKIKKLHIIVAPLMKFILSGKRVVKSMILISVLSFTPFQITGHSKNLGELNHLKFDQSYREKYKDS
jgi:hypothetical protein